jgi:hypothetical protein
VKKMRHPTVAIGAAALCLAALLALTGMTEAPASGSAGTQVDGPVLANGPLSPAAIPGASTNQTAETTDGQLTFAGYQWTVKSSTTPIGPGPNLFDATGPFVDSSGNLHLQIVHTAAGWESSEVILDPTLGYGTYSWTVDGPLSTLDPSVVMALFTYDNANTSPSNREIDFEASRWGDAGSVADAQYVVQPYLTPGNIEGITLPQSNVTTVTMTWVPGSVTFSADSLPPWTNSSSSVPTSATEQLHMNLFLFQGNAPTNGQPVSVEVTNFQFTSSTPPPPPPPTPTPTPTPSPTPTPTPAPAPAPTSAPVSASSPATCAGTLPAGTVVGTAATGDDGGYWIANNQGDVVACGDAPSFGELARAPSHPVVGIAATPDGGGYYLVASDGGVFSFGDAVFHGSTGALALNKPIVGMAVDRATGGYWLVGTDGGVFSFDAPFFGSTGSMTLNKPIVGMAPSNGGAGYWLVASDGGIFSFNAPFYGSTGGIHLNEPVVGMTADAATGGYWLVAADGGIFSFNAPFYGSTGSTGSTKPVVGMTADAATGGYWLIASDGGIFSSHAPFYGST